MHKQFTHNFVDKIELLDETNERGRHYIIPSGEKLPSVTTVLAQHMDNSWLLEWKKKIGEAKAKQISSYALRRGRAIHTIAEKYVLNEDYKANTMPIHLDMFEPIKKVLDNHVDRVYGVELPLYSKALGVAGRCDLVAKYAGTTSIIDYKTSKRLKSEEEIRSYFLQSTVYALMFERMYKIPCPQIVVIMTVEGISDPLVFVKYRSLYINEVLDIFMPSKPSPQKNIEESKYEKSSINN